MVDTPGDRGNRRDDDDPDRRDTEPLGPVWDEGPGFGSGPAYSDNISYSDGPSYSSSVGYGDAHDPDDDTRATGTARIRDDDTYERPEISEEELEGLRLDASGMPLGPRRVLPLEEEPSNLVSQYLFPTERYRGEWKRHWISLLKPISIGAGATLALGYFSGYLAKQEIPNLMTVVILIWVAVMCWAAWEVADWWFDRFILTNKRVMVVNGIITRRVGMMPLLRVTDMKYEQSAIGRIFNYGTFVLESAGQEQALREIKHLPNPNELYLRVVEEMYEPAAVEARLGRSDEEAAADDGA